MFKKHHIQVKFAKDIETPIDNDVKPVINPEDISRVAKDVAKNITVAAVTIMGAAYAFSTIHDVIVNNTDPSKKK